MNKKIITLGCLLIVLTISSCKKFLEITPQQQFTSTIATSSLDGLTKTTTGAFHQLLSSNIYGGGIIGNSELMADFVTANSISDYGLNQFRSRQLDANNANSGGLWSDAYRGIYICNVVLKYLPNFAAENAGQVQLLRGECLFIRALLHFELLRAFAQPSGFTSDDSHLGIPLVLAPGDIINGQTTPRSTVAQCYAQIVTDLDSAGALLPNALPSSGLILTQTAAQAILTRVYFTQNKFTQAKQYADMVIGAMGYTSIAARDSDVYATNGSTETIFQIISTPPAFYANSVLRGRFYGIPFHPPTCFMSNNFYPYYASDSAAGGQRSKYYRRVGAGINLEYWCNKYNDANMNTNVIRLSEILYDRAESEAQLGMSDAAVRADYNAIRVKRGLLADNTTTGTQALLNAIRGDRDIELAVEGDRLFEIKRRKISFVSPESGEVFQWNSPRLVYPIPLQEIRQNTNIVQNPGY